MEIIENSVVSLEYELTDAQNKDVVLDSNVGKEPLEFIIGKGQIIPGLESKLVGMNVGEKSDIMVAASDAYGDRDPSAVQKLPKEQFAGLDLEQGMTLYGQGEDGSTVQVTVKDIFDEEVEIDYNHPLAGKDLMFSVSVIGVREATADEALSGQVASSGEGCGCSCGEGGGGCGTH